MLVGLVVSFALVAAAPESDKPFVAIPGNEFLHGGVVQADASKIINGNSTTIYNYPWQVSLRTNSNAHTCGAIILSDTWLLTAAHCTQSRGYAINAGSTIHSIDGQRRTVRNIYNHERYQLDTWTISNDIALLELSSPLQLSASLGIAPIKLPSAGQNFDQTMCDITGWGRTCGTCSIASTLQHLSIRALANSECSTRMSGISGVNIHPSHICVFNDNGSGACNGDSGGPMACRVGGETYLAGITSWVISSQSTGCLPSYPSVYTRTSEFLSWIDSKVPGLVKSLE